MFFENELRTRIENLFEGLICPVKLYNEQGCAIAPRTAENIVLPQEMVNIHVNYHVGEFYYRPLDVNPKLYLVISDENELAEDVLLLAERLIMNTFETTKNVVGCSEIYSKVLLESGDVNALRNGVQEQNIPLVQERCVILFEGNPMKNVNLHNFLSEVLPLSHRDALVSLGYNSVALIKDVSEFDGVDDLRQYALAVGETLWEEGEIIPLIGVGSAKKELFSLGESYKEAKTSISIGKRYHENSKVFVFERLLFERFLASSSMENSDYYQNLLFNERTKKLLNGEMLKTIEVFFEKNLNVSDSSRQLFIHRNTLVYRLDKIQRQTGLDLRNFDDAVAFKLLYTIKKGNRRD